MRIQCPLWVKLGRSVASALSPLHAEEQTIALESSESGACQKRRDAVIKGPAPCEDDVQALRPIHERNDRLPHYDRHVVSAIAVGKFAGAPAIP
jgi:hypothetical protein